MLVPKDSKSKSNSKCPYAIGVFTLSITTLVLIIALIINGFSGGFFNRDPQDFGFKNDTGSISDSFYTDITPAGWTFSIWGIIYIFQIVWILYGWSFVFRPNTTPTITPITYIMYSLCNIINIIWLYLWGNELPQAAFPFLVLISAALWIAIAIQVFYLNRIASDPPTKRQKEFKIDYYLTQFIVINGLAIYSTWTAIATLINFSIVLQYYGEFNGVNVGTAALCLLAIELIVYFIMENIFLDRFLRFVFIVYPVIIWALSGVLSAQGTDNRNGVFTAILIALTCVLFVIRWVLWIIFAIFRPINSTRLFGYKQIV